MSLNIPENVFPETSLHLQLAAAVAALIFARPSGSELILGGMFRHDFATLVFRLIFLAAGAAVVEVGSYLSHAGTVAREFGMPCLVDATDCTRRIRTGMRLDVDGSSGVVRVLADAV